uniref:SFRICE_025960 n=1 Tax=Spodoptera frugiperda TaxID=7108 RepID=A0A2H1WPS3_SPOFR
MCSSTCAPGPAPRPRDSSKYYDVPPCLVRRVQVTFQVRELSRVVGGINTTVSENEGNLVLGEWTLIIPYYTRTDGAPDGVKMPNVLGRGERVAAEYSMGYRSSSNFSVAATKPFPHKPLVPVLTATVYQQNHEYPWSGYRLLDRGALLDLAFKTSPATHHNVQWEGLVRDTSVLSKTTSFKVRESSGPQMKSILRHIVCVDQRDEAMFPTRGCWVQFSSELAGLGGGVAHLRTELHAQANRSLPRDLVLQAAAAVGVLHDVFGTELADHFFLGGPTSLRGFRQRGVGPHAEGQATGGRVYWAAGLHLYAPLPFQGSRTGLASLFRSHLFANAGCLAMPEGSGLESLESLRLARVSVGAGVVVRLGRGARLELNYAVPLRAQPHDVHAPGIQFGVGANFL